MEEMSLESSHKIDRASDRNAGEAVHRHRTSHDAHSADSMGPPATSQEPYFVFRNDSGHEVWWDPRTRSYIEKTRNHNAVVAEVPSHSSTPSTPRDPAPHYCISNGTPIPLERESNNQNAEAAEAKFSPQDAGTGKGQLTYSKVSSTSARPAPLGLVARMIWFFRHLVSVPKALADYIGARSAYNSQDRVRTNFGWISRDDLERDK